MLYLLDANVLIRAHQDYYPLDRVRGFWTWLCAQAEAGFIKMPSEVHDEVVEGTDELAEWIGEPHVKNLLLLDEEVDQQIFQQVLDDGYGQNLTEDEIDEIGRDPFLVAYALMGDNRTVVTKEVSRPSRGRGHTKLPDACSRLNVRWITDFALYRELNFRLG